PAARLVELLDLRLDVAERGARFLPLAQDDDRLHLVVFVDPDRLAVRVLDLLAVLIVLGTAKADLAEAGLMADDDAAGARRLTGAQRAAVDDVVDANRLVVGRGQDDLANLAN